MKASEMMKALEMMKASEIMRKLAETDGENGASWDPEVLSMAADSCIRGDSPWDFEGQPTDAEEMQRFADVWQNCQTSNP